MMATQSIYDDVPVLRVAVGDPLFSRPWKETRRWFPADFTMFVVHVINVLWPRLFKPATTTTTTAAAATTAVVARQPKNLTDLLQILEMQIDPVQFDMFRQIAMGDDFVDGASKKPSGQAADAPSSSTVMLDSSVFRAVGYVVAKSESATSLSASSSSSMSLIPLVQGLATTDIKEALMLFKTHPFIIDNCVVSLIKFRNEEKTLTPLLLVEIKSKEWDPCTIIGAIPIHLRCLHLALEPIGSAYAANQF